jgi:hypothetical protein
MLKTFGLETQQMGELSVTKSLDSVSGVKQSTQWLISLEGWQNIQKWRFSVTIIFPKFSM